MKIIVTVHTYWPSKNGVQYVTQYLCEGLAHKGHNVTVITTLSDSNKVRRCIHNNVNIIYTYLKTKYSIINFGVSEYRKVFLEESKNADWIINCCVQSPTNNVLLPILKKLTAKKMLYMHGIHSFNIQNNDNIDLNFKLWHIIMNIRWRMFYWLNKKNFCQYDSIVDIHEKSLGISFMRKIGVKSQSYIISNAVEDFDKISITSEDEKNYPALKSTYMLNVSNFTNGKNQIMLIEAYKKIKYRNNVKLILIGKKSEYSKLIKKRIIDYHLENDIIIFENQEREITQKFIKNCFCGVMSSRFEVFPIFICEIISCEHPYISTDVGCVKDIPGGDIVNTTEQMTQAMQHMINNDKHRKDLAISGKQFAIKYLTQQSKINQLENILMSKLNN